MMIRNKIDKLNVLLDDLGPKVIACSGGLDSLLLSYCSHRRDPRRTLVVLGVSPSVPKDAQARVDRFADKEGWELKKLGTMEFEDETYLKNPYDRCYFCKRHLYGRLKQFRYLVSRNAFIDFCQQPNKEQDRAWEDCAVLSGANTDDLGEHRPGLLAAKEFGVRHPFVEAGISKEDIRLIARHMKLSFAELAASPCLSSRLYTGTRVTSRRLELVERAESLIKDRAGVRVVRCRLKERRMLIEVGDPERSKLTEELVDRMRSDLLAAHADILDEILIDPLGYSPGKAFVPVR